MKSIHAASIAPVLALALIAQASWATAADPDQPNGAAPPAPPGAYAPETDDQCRAYVRPLRDAYRDAVNKNGASSFTAQGLRSQLDQAYGDCCRAHASRWSWCDAGGAVRTDEPDQYPYDPGW